MDPLPENLRFYGTVALLVPMAATTAATFAGMAAGMLLLVP